MIDIDILIVGGGIAGAGIGAALAGRRRALLIEAEPQCGYHSTGRSAAFWLESYGGPAVAPLTRASHGPLERGGFLRTRGALHIARTDDFPDLQALPAVDRPDMARRVPGLRDPWRHGRWEANCADIDVASLHQAMLRHFRNGGGEIRCDSRLIDAVHDGSGWTVSLADGDAIRAQIIVNAGGAWADAVAALAHVQPLGIQPKRRTMVQLRVAQGDLVNLPLVSDAEGHFYFKGSGDRSIWLSPHDENDCDPCDAAPEEIDIATAIARFEEVVDWPVEAVERSWAGLRSFSPDRVPVYGFDVRQAGFFWCAGQGGFGIQTAPAASALAAALLMGEAPAIDPAPFDPRRFA